LTGDVISLTDIDANIALSGDQAFQFVGTAAFTGIGQIRYFQSGDKTIIQGNTDSDVGTIEFEVHLTGDTYIDEGLIRPMSRIGRSRQAPAVCAKFVEARQ
jgi:hypothetical protein